MLTFFTKIWTLGGWFYLSLLVIWIFYLRISPKSREAIFFLLLMFSTATSSFFFLRDYRQLSAIMRNFFLSNDAKTQKTTDYQAGFAQKLISLLPESATGCVYPVIDIPNHYLIQKLYPRKFKLLNEATIDTCNYVVSQFEPKQELAEHLVFSYQNNYLYKLKQP